MRPHILFYIFKVCVRAITEKFYCLPTPKSKISSQFFDIPRTSRISYIFDDEVDGFFEYLRRNPPDSIRKKKTFPVNNISDYQTIGIMLSFFSYFEFTLLILWVFDYLMKMKNGAFSVRTKIRKRAYQIYSLFHAFFFSFLYSFFNKVRKVMCMSECTLVYFCACRKVRHFLFSFSNRKSTMTQFHVVNENSAEFKRRPCEVPIFGTVLFKRKYFNLKIVIFKYSPKNQNN